MGKADKEALEKKIEDGLAAERKMARKERKNKVKENKKKFSQEFREFITKGNVIDLAVAVVIGSSFNAITNGLVKMIINPAIAILTGDISLDDIKTVLREAELAEDGVTVVTPEIAILWGSWIQTIIQFLIIAFSIFIALKVIKRAGAVLRHKELKAAEETAKIKAEEEAAAKAIADAEAAAKAEAEAAEAARKEAELQAFYSNVARQTALLEELIKKEQK